MRNDLVNAPQGLATVAQHRVIKSCVSKLDSMRLDNGRYKVQLTAAEYAATFHIGLNTAYEQLKKTASELLDCTFERQVTLRGKRIVHKDHWVSGITYFESEARLELRFSPEATPYLCKLNGNHTTFGLRHTTRLRSVYSWRLLELLMQYRDTGWKHINITEFKRVMEVQESHTKNFKDLRRCVIEPAMRELSAKIQWRIDCQIIKSGRKVIALRFTFESRALETTELDKRG